MQVRLAFTVAILARTDLLIMDEVLAVGDASFQEKCFDVFNTYKREGKTIVLVSHDLGALEEYCDRVLLLNHGQVIADGPAAEVTSAYHRMIAEHSMAIAQESTATLARDPNQSGPRAVQVMSVALLDGKGQTVAELRHRRPDDSRYSTARARGRRRLRLRDGYPSR